MTSTPTAPLPAASDVPTVADAAADLAVALESLQTADRETAKAVLAVSRIIGTGIAETVEGLPLDLVLANLCRLIRSDRSTVVTAADVLRSMPITAGLWLDGQLSWGQVRTIVSRARRLRVDDREVLDRRLAQSRDRHDGLDAYGPDGLLDAVHRAADELDGLARVEKQAEHAERSEFAALQQSFDGGLTGYFQLGPVNGAIVANALDAAKPAHDPTVKRGKRMAMGLTEMAKRSLSGGAGKPAKPLIDVIVDTSQTTRTAGGTIDLNVPGHLPTLTARVVEILNTDATLRVTLTDGHRPLATSRKVHAKDTPASNVLASRLRDRGDRMPGSTAPLAWTDTHHIVHREHGGDHDVSNLVNLASGNHQRLHRHGWRSDLDPTTGVFTIERDGRRFRSLPRGSPLEPDPGPPPVIHLDDDGDPIPF